MTTETAEASKFMTYAELARRRAQDRSTLWRLVQAGLLPKPVRLSPGRVAFVRAEIEAAENALPRVGEVK